MKKIDVVVLTAFLVLLNGCSPTSKNTISENQTNQETTTVSPSDTVEAETPLVESSQEIAKDTHLELKELENCYPRFCLDFVKIEGGTGKQIEFTNSIITREPEGQIDGFSQPVEPDDDNVLSCMFCYIGSENSVKFTVDDLDYVFEIPPTESREIELKQNISYKGYTASIQKATIYPNAVSLLLTDVSDLDIFRANFYLKVNGESHPPNDRYCPNEEDLTTQELIYVYEDGLIPSQIQSLNIGRKDDVTTFDLSLE